MLNGLSLGFIVNKKKNHTHTVIGKRTPSVVSLPASPLFVSCVTNMPHFQVAIPAMSCSLSRYRSVPKVHFFFDPRSERVERKEKARGTGHEKLLLLFLSLDVALN